MKKEHDKNLAFKNYLTSLFSDLKVIERKKMKWWKLAIVILILTILLTSIAVSSYMYYRYHKNLSVDFDVFSGVKISYLLIGIIVLSVIFLLIFLIVLNHFDKKVNGKHYQNRDANRAKFWSRISKESSIYQKYFELTYPNSGFKFDGIYQSFNKLAKKEGYEVRLTRNNQILSCFWLQSERYYEEWEKDKEGNYQKIKYKEIETYDAFQINVPDLKGYELIEVDNLSDKGFASKTDRFFSESIVFNEKYFVKGKNQLQMTKFFRPKRIDNFNNSQRIRRFKILDGIVFDNRYTKKTFNLTKGDKNIPIRNFYKISNREKYNDTYFPEVIDYLIAEIEKDLLPVLTALIMIKKLEI